jgi:hypothetical protein
MARWKAGKLRDPLSLHLSVAMYCDTSISSLDITCYIYVYPTYNSEKIPSRSQRT